MNPSPSVWDTYPTDYRAAEVRAILAATRAGESVSVIGLSGAGKSNLMGFLAQRHTTPEHPLILVDCNRLSEFTSAAVFRLARRALGETEAVPDEWDALEVTLAKRLTPPTSSLSLLFDRFDSLSAQPTPALFSNLRALRDRFKFQLTFVFATRRPLDAHTELAELVYANTLWLGPLSESDARWNVRRYAERHDLAWDDATAHALITASAGYPALLRAACEAHSAGTALEVTALVAHPAVQRRLTEFWADQPTPAELQNTRLIGIPLLQPPAPAPAAPTFDTARLTAKENALLAAFLARPNAVQSKDDLIRAVWPEDKIYTQGVRDDSLAQLIRRLREKIEPDPAHPRYIHTLPGRGYRFAVK